MASSTPVGYLEKNHRYFHLRDTAGQERDFHYHSFDKIVILKSGKVDYIVENVTYPLRPGSVLLVRHHAIHKALIDKSEPYDRVIIYLNPEFFASALPDTELTACFSLSDRSEKSLLLPGEESLSELNSLLEGYEAASADTRYGADAYRDTIIMQLLILLNRILAEGGETPAAEDGITDEKIRRAVEFIDSHITEPLSVDALAEYLYLSKYHFMRQFKLQTGSTVHAYVRQKRLLHAARLIREGMPAGSAAAESGFADYSTFSRAFRECFGIKPADLKDSRAL